MRAKRTESLSLKSAELTVPFEIHFSIVPDRDFVSGALPVNMFIPFSNLSGLASVFTCSGFDVIFPPLALSLSPRVTIAK